MNESQAKKVGRHHYKDHLSRAQQSLDVAKYAFEQGKWDACAINCVQAGISASDAYCIFKLSLHNASQRHDDAIKLFSSIDPANETHKTNANRLRHLLSEKSGSAYGEQPVKKNEAEYLLTEAGRLLNYVKSKMPE